MRGNRSRRQFLGWIPNPPYDKSLIAGRLGLKPESLSRVFARLRTMGIDVRASDVVVEDAAILLALVAGDRVSPRGSFGYNGKRAPKRANTLGFPV